MPDVFGSLNPQDWRDEEAARNLAAIEAAKPRTWGDTWNDAKAVPGALAGMVKGLVAPQTSSQQATSAALPSMPAGAAFGSLSPGEEAAIPETVASRGARGLTGAMGEAIASGVTAPGDALAGKIPVYGDDGRTSTEMVKRAFDTAGLAGGASAGASVGRLAADSGKAAAPIIAAEHAPKFYSSAERAFNEINQPRMTGDQWLGTLSNRPGVRPEELDWRGVTDFLKQRGAQPVTREELAGHFSGNPVNIDTVDLKSPKPWRQLSKEERVTFVQRNNLDPERMRGAGEYYEGLREDARLPGSSKWDQYALPGAENYRERLLKLDNNRDAMMSAATDARLKYGIDSPEYARALDAAPTDYKSNHWDQPNVLAHRRSSDRYFDDPGANQGALLDDIESRVRAAYPDVPRDSMGAGMTAKAVRDGVLQPADASQWARANGWNAPGYYDPATDTMAHRGGVRSLHAEEIQSDWHQTGRKQGYAGENKPLNDAQVARAQELAPQIQAMRDRGMSLDEVRETPVGQEMTRLQDQQTAHLNESRVGMVPNGPFKKTWHQLAANDMLREAAEGGYPRVSWTAGEHSPTSPKNLGHGTVEEQAAADAGMQGFYNKMLPDYLNKVGKSHGAKVQEGNLPITGGMSGDDAMRLAGIPEADRPAFWADLAEKGGIQQFMDETRSKGHRAFYMDIPDSLRQQALTKGFSLFEDTGPAAQALSIAGHAGEQNAQRAITATGDDVGRGAASGAGSLEEAAAAAARRAGAAEPLPGLPAKGMKIGDEFFVPGPIASVRDVADSYMATRNPAEHSAKFPTQYHDIDPARAGAIAKAFEEMPHAPDDPRVQASYGAMVDETRQQYEHLMKSGLKVSPITPDMADPYALNPRLAAKDAADNNHLWFFPTDQGFGSGVQGFDMSKHPMMQPSGIELNGKQLLNNDLFRIVHDYFGHFKEGYGFRGAGEDNAWRSHAAMYSDKARPAMTTETRGQNSWVNYGPHGEKNRTANSADTVFAEQKVGLLPDWVMGDSYPGAKPHYRPETLAEDRSRMRGEKPEKTLRDFIKGKRPLLSVGGAAAAAPIFGSLDGGGGEQ